MSAIIFHGPRAKLTAYARVKTFGVAVAPYIEGDGTLKIDQLREFVEHLLSTPMTTKIGVVVIGPVDRCTTGSDVLLKALEEYDAKLMLPILWAHDLEDVSPTIRSRCLEQWCPHDQHSKQELEGEDVRDWGEECYAVYNAWVQKRYHDIPPLLQKLKKNETVLLNSLVDSLHFDIQRPGALQLWLDLRSALRWGNPTIVEIAAVMLPHAPKA